MANAAFLAQVRDAGPAWPGDVRLMNATASMLFVVFAIGFVVLAVNWATRHAMFSLNRIEVSGEVMHNSASSIRANAMPRLAGNFFTVDLDSGRRAFESVPWVRHAIVRRIWPSTLAVQLEEHRAAAVWSGDPRGDKLVNTHGEVFEVNLGDVEDDGLPTLSGPDGTAAQVLAMWRRLRPMFERLGNDVNALAMSERGSWRVELDTGAEVELGRGTDDEVVTRTERFIATVTQVTERYQRALEYADLRHNEAYAVRLKGITTVDPRQTGKR